MGTGVKKGLTPARKIGSGPDNKGISTYQIEDGYTTSLFVGDPVALSSDGFIEKASNGSATVGVYLGSSYTNAEGTPTWADHYPGGISGEIECKVLDDPDATFLAHIDSSAESGDVVNGGRYGVTMGTGDPIFGLSGAVVNISGGTVASGSGMVRVKKVVDSERGIVEVTLANHTYS